MKSHLHMANGRKRSNTINSIIVNNEELVDQRDLNKASTEYYRYIFGNKNKNWIDVGWNDLYPSDSIVDLSELDNPFTEEEIRKAISDLPGDKSPVADSFPIFFYKTFWDVLKLNLINMFNDFYNGNLQPGRFNFANINLLHKK